MIFAAGTGSRLKPLTDHTPKALIPIGGKPMLEHVILKLKSSGFDQIVINIHHLGNQIVDFLEARNYTIPMYKRTRWLPYSSASAIPHVIYYLIRRIDCVVGVIMRPAR